MMENCIPTEDERIETDATPEDWQTIAEARQAEIEALTARQGQIEPSWASWPLRRWQKR